MKYTKKQLKEIREFYEMLAHQIVKRNRWGKKLPEHIQSILSQYNLIINLVEEVEDSRKEAIEEAYNNELEFLYYLKNEDVGDESEIANERVKELKAKLQEKKK